MALGWTNRDPTAGVRGCRSTEIHTWNEGEISVFEHRWPEGKRERLTFALLLNRDPRGRTARTLQSPWPSEGGRTGASPKRGARSNRVGWAIFGLSRPSEHNESWPIQSRAGHCSPLPTCGTKSHAMHGA